MQPWQRHIGNDHVGTHAGSHTGSRLSHDTTAEHQHLDGLNARHATDELALSALGLLQIVGTVYCCHTSCHLTHRNEQRQGAVVELHRLVSQTHAATLYHGICELAVRSEMKIGKQ